MFISLARSFPIDLKSGIACPLRPFEAAWSCSSIEPRRKSDQDRCQQCVGRKCEKKGRGGGKERTCEVELSREIANLLDETPIGEYVTALTQSPSRGSQIPPLEKFKTAKERT